jgi:hypothetical protein
MALQVGAEVELRLPHVALVVAVDPDQQLFLGALGLAAAAVRGGDGLEGLEIVRHVVRRQVLEKRRAEGDHGLEVALQHVDVFAVLLQRLLDGPEICPLDPAEMHVPLILAHDAVEDCGLR